MARGTCHKRYPLTAVVVIGERVFHPGDNYITTKGGGGGGGGWGGEGGACREGIFIELVDECTNMTVSFVGSDLTRVTCSLLSLASLSLFKKKKSEYFSSDVFLLTFNVC